jgi:thiol-disulfide isomerase/thioredoxin
LRFRRTLALVATTFTAAVSLVGCSTGAGSQTGGLKTVNNAAFGITQFREPGRDAAPRLSGSTTTGVAYTTSYVGHVTVLNIWGSWCVQCREEAASFAEASKDFAAKGVQFIGIDTMDNNSTANSYIARYGIAYPSLADPNEALLLILKNLIPIEGVPSTLIVDRNGKVAVRAIGGITEPELDQELNYALSAS